MRFRLLGFAAGCALVLLVALLLNRGRWHGPARVLSETEGALATVEVQYTRQSAPASWPCLKAFFAQLDPSVEVIAVCADDLDASEFKAAFEALPKHPECFSTVVVGSPITGWSKDRFLVAAGTPSTLLCPKFEGALTEGRSNDAKVGPALAKRWPERFQAAETALVFDSGDVLCTDTQALFCDSLAAKNPGVRDLASSVAHATGLSPVWLKGVPDHHVGMFAAPLDGRTAIVADPDLGKRLWRPEAEKALGKPDLSDATLAPFRRVADEMRKAGFKVIPAPIVVFEPKVYATYTNGVFEQRGGHKVVYMPSYGLRELDEAGTRAYRDAGWEVRPIPVASVFRYRGTIGCLVNVLERR